MTLSDQVPPPTTPSAAAAVMSADPWPAPTLSPSQPVDATVRIPGSKSLTNRHLLLAAVADGPSHLRCALDSRDTRLMISALEALGARFRWEETGDLLVTPLDRSSTAETGHAPLAIDTGLAGTVMRFIPPLAALLGRPAAFDGDPGARLRPMGPVLDAVTQLGCRVHSDPSTPGRLPFTQSAPHPQDLAGSPTITIDASASSQFLSALLLTGFLAPEGLVITHRGGPLPSLPHVQMTVQVLADYGIPIRRLDEATWEVPPARPQAHDVVVEPDLSNAGPFLAAAVLTGGRVRIPNWPQHTTQGGDRWRELLPRFGAQVQREGQDLIVTGPENPSALPGIDADLSEAGELAPTVAAIAAVASSPSRLTGIGHLRGHETNRLAALVTEIRRLGGAAEELPTGLEITTPISRSGTVRTYEDHRMATAAAIMGLRQPGILVQNVMTTAKTLPEFVTMWAQMIGQPR